MKHTEGRSDVLVPFLYTSVRNDLLSPYYTACPVMSTRNRRVHSKTRSLSKVPHMPQTRILKLTSVAKPREDCSPNPPPPSSVPVLPSAPPPGLLIGGFVWEQTVHILPSPRVNTHHRVLLPYLQDLVSDGPFESRR